MRHRSTQSLRTSCGGSLPRNPGEATLRAQAGQVISCYAVRLAQAGQAIPSRHHLPKIFSVTNEGVPRPVNIDSDDGPAISYPGLQRQLESSC